MSAASSNLSLSRRHVLQLLGVGAAGLAFPLGCAKSDKATGGSGEFRAAYPYNKPPKGHFNYLGGVTDQIVLGYLWDLMMVPGATYLWSEQKYYYLLADESSKLSPDGKTFTYVVRDGLRWSDGKPITATDVYRTWLLRWANAHAVFDYVESFEQTDEKTVTFRIRTPSPVTQYYLLRERPVADAQFGKYAEQVEPLFTAGKGNDDAAIVEIVEEINKFKPKEAIVSGPFHVDYDSVGNQELTLVKNDTGYKADDINFDSIKVYNGETIVVTPLVLNNSIDYATHGFAVASEEQFMKIGYDILRPPTYYGLALYMSFGKCPEFSDKRARQALAYVIDRAQIGKVTYGDSGLPGTYMSGMSDRFVEQWIAKPDRARFNTYDKDLDQAADLLQQAGWQKRGDGWYTPDGKAATYDITYASELSNTGAAAQNLASQFGEFGIKLTLFGTEGAQMEENVQASKFEFALNSWGTSGNPFPSASYRPVLIDYNVPGLSADKQQGIDFPMQQDTDIVGPIDLEQAITDSGLGKNEDALKANVTRLALAFNELLPVVPLYERLGNNPIDREVVAGWPPAGDPIYLNSPYADNFTTILMYEGKLKPA